MIFHSRPWINQDDINFVNETLNSGMISSGEKVKEFEKAFASYTSTKNAIACNSGLSALILGLSNLGIKKNDEIIMPTYVCHSVADAVKFVGAKPVFCDSGSLWNITAETVDKCITSQTKAIIAVHILGVSAETRNFMHFNTPVIENFCQALGLPNNITGDMAFFSFNATKCLATGEGGMLVSNNTLNCDNSPYKMTDIQAALGLSQLKRFDVMLKKRRKIAEKYLLKLPDYLTQEISQVKDRTMFFRFPLRYKGNKSFEEIQAEFAENNIAVRHGVDKLLHREYGFSDNNFKIKQDDPCNKK